MSEATNEVSRTLNEDGPLTFEELPWFPNETQLREMGIQRFKPAANYGGSPENGGGQSHTIYYLEGKHECIDVVEKWLESNPKILEALTQWAVHQRIADYGDDFREASREALGPMHDGNPDQEHEAKTCPNCGEGGLKSIAEHLPECPEL